MQQQHVNRAEQLWKNWEAQQKQLDNFFGSGNENLKAIMQQKYNFLRHGLNRLSVNPSPEEKLYSHVIATVTAKLRRALYPNRLMRLFHQLKVNLQDRPREIKAFSNLRNENLVRLAAQLDSSGFGSFSGRLENYLDFERQRIDIPLSTQLSGSKSLDVVLHLEKDNSGQYQMERFTGTVKDQYAPENNRSYTFSYENGMDARKAANLLQGRAVFQSWQQQGNYCSQWLQLDFNTTGSSPQLKEFKADYGYDLQTQLNELAAKLGIRDILHEKALKGLEKGDQVTYKGIEILNETIYLEASPGNKSISLRDKEQNLIQSDFLLEKMEQSREQANSFRAEQVLKQQPVDHHEIKMSL